MASPQMFVLRHAIRNHNLIKCGCINSLNSITAKNSMGNDSINLSGASTFLYKFSSSSDCISCIHKIVDNDSNLVLQIADEHHRGVLTAWGGAGVGSAFLLGGRGVSDLVQHCTVREGGICRGSIRASRGSRSMA